MNSCGLDADFARFCLIVEFWLMTECAAEVHENLAARLAVVRKGPCVIGNCCSDTYVKATLQLLRQLPGWEPSMEQKALAGSGFAHLYIADGYH